MIAPDVLETLRLPLFSFAFKTLRVLSRSDQDDLVQETLTRVWAAEADIRDPLDYATRVMRNLHVDQQRRPAEVSLDLLTEEGRYAAAVVGGGTALGVAHVRPSRVLAVLDIQRCQVCGSWDARCTCCG